MISSLSFVLLLLAGPVLCPPDQGQIRWDGFSFPLDAHGKKYELRGTLWDRDRNGAPSRGDLYRLDQLLANGRVADIGEAWFVVSGELAARYTRRFKTISKRLTANCESQFKIEGVETLTSPAALARFLKRNMGGAEKISPEDLMRGDMEGWAGKLCKSRRHVSKDQLADYLAKQAMRRYAKLGKPRVHGIADEIATERVLECARVDGQGDYTFK